MNLLNTFDWAVWAAESSNYLEKLDACHPGEPISPSATHPDLVDIAHVRWATANAITAIDLCAATIGHLFCPPQGTKELSLRDFDNTLKRTAKDKAEVVSRRSSLPQGFLRWIEETLADQRYIDLHGARNPFTHSWLQRHVSIGGTGHEGRTQFTVRGTSHRMNARDMVVGSASLALDRVRAFVEVVDQYER
jgi:hypothetical protein